MNLLNFIAIHVELHKEGKKRCNESHAEVVEEPWDGAGRELLLVVQI